MAKATIINLGFGNLYGLNQALLAAGFNSEISENFEDANNSDALILPGVGSFGNGIDKLKNSGWYSVVQEWIAQNRPLLGICLGMQLLFEKSYEFGEHKGFGQFKGNVQPIIKDNNDRVPKMGWYNLVTTNDNQKKKMQDIGLDPNERVYFVHSFGAKTDNDENVTAYVEYSNQRYIAAIQKQSVWGVQFHPENSADNGINFLKSFYEFTKAS